MAEFVMPTLGADMSVGTLMTWLKQPGETVARGDIIAVVHTDKADVEVEVFTNGVLERVLVEPGAEVPVGTVLAVIREDGAPAAPPSAAPAPAAPAAPAPAEAGAHIAISPSARHLAEELGVDPALIEGSGPGGRIQRKDVEAAAAAGEAAAAPPPAPPPAPPTGLAVEDRNAAMRRAIAAAMSRSKREIPHFYLGQTIHMSNAIAWLAQENLRRPVPERLLHGVLLLKAIALALREVPELNAVWQGEELVLREDINVGVAIALRGGGLVAPAIHRTDQLSMDELMHAFRDLVSRARSWSLRSSEMTDPTITVTSLGERGVETVFGVIFPPQVAIVGFGTLVERPWISEGQVLICPVVNASLSADHRVTDGHRASAFLAAIDRLLQEPDEL
ncbi:MAG: 2-oxo acid dehydrogenase subunit E2 [Thermoleophilia bacterium]|nr:2-oxo acid dehydrogenase subunit E2 [Thermoleophilia bacterium]MDH4339020.1 2-oxo acid dehydrogenase subunit E2 [Thermoleophilia bacterium]MDH5281218.1 2-oxo acid dehydrogenase subunit E2 [Thermoleophilia bacterium]